MKICLGIRCQIKFNLKPDHMSQVQIVLIAWYLSLFTPVLTAQNSANQTKPNIIYILADDLGYGDLGCYGQDKIKTPHIDELARHGMKFTQHYSGSPVCAPARYIFLTGQHSGHAFIRGNHEWPERGDVWDYRKAVEDVRLEGQYPIPNSTVTLGETLQSAGYTTALVGKWGLGAPGTEGVPNKQGFDYFYGYNCQRQAHNLYPPFLWENDQRVWLDNEIISPQTKIPEGSDPYDPESYRDFIQTDYAPEKMLEAAIGFIDRHKSDPFFLYYASPIPHAPLQVPPAYYEKYIGDLGAEEPYLGDMGYFPHRYPRAAYAGMITYLDEQVGQLIDKLKAEGLYDNTLVIFTSDNGPTFNGGTQSPWFESGGPFPSERGRGKAYVYEGGIRVPFIASWPGVIEAGSKSEVISAFWDMMPTFNAIAEVKNPASIDGVNLLPVLMGTESDVDRDHLYWEFPAYGGQQAVRMGDWKAVRQNISKGNLEIELYNLKTDLAEQHDVAADHPDLVRKMAEIMQAEHATPIVDRFRMKALDGKK